MNRRTLLSLSGAGLASLAGCGSTAPEPTELTATDEPTPTPEPEFELTSFETPDEAEIGEEFSFSFTVRNISGRSAEFSTELEVRLAGDEWSSAGEWSEEMDPNSEQTFESRALTANYLGEYDVRLTYFDEVATTVFVPARVQFGYSHEFYNGAVASVLEIVEEDEIGAYQTGSGEKFMRAFIQAENTAENIITLPSPASFALLADNSQYERQGSYDGAYPGGEVQPGVVRSGYVTFVVPDDVSRSDIQIVWSRQFAAGDVAVYWSSSQSE